jgi:hypothetical protein
VLGQRLANGAAAVPAAPTLPCHALEAACVLMLLAASTIAPQERSGLLIAPPSSLTFLLFLIVTRETPVTGFMPSFCIAFRLFFSPRDCLLLPGCSSSARARPQC